jgi:diguanylate cyclase (GGDEF)-like protein
LWKKISPCTQWPILLSVQASTFFQKITDSLHHVQAHFDGSSISFLVSGGFILFIIIKNRQLKKAIHYCQAVEYEVGKSKIKLEKSLALSKATLEATADGILVVDKERKIVGYNQKFRKMWKIPQKVLMPGNDQEAARYVLSQVKDPNAFIKNLERFYNLQPGSEVIGLVEFKDGRIFERYTKPQVYNNKVIGRVFSFRDVTKRKEMEKQLMYQATHDALTTLPNRVILMDRINQSIKFSKRIGRLSAILFFDLDRFKLVNDSLGHTIGDSLLQSVSERLQRCVRDDDTVSRWGGDEFILLLTNLLKEEDVIPIVNKCLEALEIEFSLDHYKLRITSSVGISFYPKNGETADELLKNADSAMYYAKAAGRNTYKFYTPEMNARTKYLLDLSTELRTALEKDQLELLYQPLLDIGKNKVVAAEALLRWTHPKYGSISPQEFIPLAEDTGLILPIGEWVLRKACAEAKKWHNAGFTNISVAVNLSSQQFKNKDITSLIQNILRESQLDPKYLDLELTEGIIMENTQVFLNAMQELKKIGVNLVIDDFGTGYSSLSYLKMFPVDKIKIDKSFIDGIPQDANDEAIVRAILAMAKQLNLQVVAEGIERKEQLEFLKQYACEEGQGFLFSRPISAQAFMQLLTQKVQKTKKTILCSRFDPTLS